VSAHDLRAPCARAAEFGALLPRWQSADTGKKSTDAGVSVLRNNLKLLLQNLELVPSGLISMSRPYQNFPWHALKPVSDVEARLETAIGMRDLDLVTSNLAAAKLLKLNKANSVSFFESLNLTHQLSRKDEHQTESSERASAPALRRHACRAKQALG
jgi:hypothetical protein